MKSKLKQAAKPWRRLLPLAMLATASVASAISAAAAALESAAAPAASAALAAPASASAGSPIGGPALRPALRVPQAQTAPLIGVTHAGKTLVAWGDHGVVLTSADGEHWLQSSVPLDTPITAVSFADASQGWAVGHGGAILHSTDGGRNWQVQTKVPDAPVLLDLWFENAQHGIAVGAYGSAFDTRDGGHSWQRVKVGEGRDGDLHLNAIFAGRAGVLFLAGEGGAAFRSLDHGATWSRLATGVSSSLWAGVMLKNGTVLLAGMSGRILASDDQGASWRVVDSGSGEALTAVTELPDGRVVAVGNGGVVAVAPAGTLSFTAAVRADRQNIAAATAGRAANELFLFGQQGWNRQALAR